MHIGMILDKTFPPDPRVENEALTLIEAGHTVFLFCLTYDDEANEEYSGIRVKRYKSNQFTYKLSALAYELPLYSIFLRPKISEFIKKHKIEALHIHDIRIAGSVFKVNNKYKLPIVLDLHDNIPEVMKDYPHLKKFPGKYLISPHKWLKKEQEFIEKANKVVTVSQEFVNLIKKRLKNHKEKVVLVPNSVRKSFYKDANINNELVNRFNKNFVLLYIGDTGQRRGLQTAIEAIPILKKTISNIRLIIVGKSSNDRKLKQLVQKLKVEKQVCFEGWQNEKLLPSYVKSANIGISPLIRSKQHDVAYANKLFQYMSFGLPVLVSNAIAQKHLIEKTKTGLVHTEKDYIDFAKKVVLLFKDKNLYTNFGKNAIEFIENEFHWELTSKNLIKMYDELKNEIQAN